MNANDVLSAVIGQADAHHAHPAVQDLDRALTYGELVDEVGRVAAGLAARGVREGDRVALLLPNSVDFVVAALASLWVGAVFVPLAVTDPEARVAAIVADCDPRIVITGATDDPQAPADDPGANRVPLPDLTVAGGEPVSAPTLDPERVAYAIYTSGTTGKPKGVLIGHGSFTAAVSSAAAILGIDGTTRALCVSPFYFDGSFGTLFPTLFVGGTVVIRPRESLLFPWTFFRAVRREHITFTGFSPSYLKLLLANPEMGTLKESTLEVVALGGEASSAADINALWEAVPGVRVFNRYGPTETTIAVTHLELTPELMAGGTVPIGHPHPGVTFHIIDDDGRVVEGAGRIGELYIGGSQLMTSYWGAPDLTAEVMRSDVVPGATVYRTGDLVQRDDRGDYLYVDRVDRVIKRLGVRISLVEVADAMRGLDGVSAAACVVFDNDGEVGIAAFVATDGSISTLDLRLGARQQLPDTMLPDRIELVDELPMTRSSKLDERRLLIEAGLREVGSDASRGAIA